MNITDMPLKFPIPFANAAGGAYIRSIPIASQIGISAGAASLTDGFTPDTFQPIASGGSYVSGKDFNGLFNQVTAWARWQAAGGAAYYDGTFSSAIGGYPKGARLNSSVTSSIVWISTADGNTTDPDGGSAANWVSVQPATLAAPQIISQSVGSGYFSRKWSDNTFEVGGIVSGGPGLTGNVSYGITLSAVSFFSVSPMGISAQGDNNDAFVANPGLSSMSYHFDTGYTGLTGFGWSVTGKI